nr:transcription initiation factor tfiid subunit 6 [Hymenolepis microstoma]
MFNDERKKLNRLSRRVPGSGAIKKRTINRLAAKTLSKNIKHANTPASNALRPGLFKNAEFPDEFFKTCAEINAVTSLHSDGIARLQKHIHFATTALVQRTIRFMEQNRRGTPHLSDIESAAIAMGLEVPYGAASGELIPIRNNVRTVPGTPCKTLLIKKDEEVDVQSLLRRQINPVIYDVSLSAHWLAIEGVQPACPQNPSPAFLSKMQMIAGTQTHKSIPPGQISGTLLAKTESDSQANGDDKSRVDERTRNAVFLDALHIDRYPSEISLEMMGFFRELTEGIVGANESRRKDALENALVDTGIQPLVPHLIAFITEGVRMNSVHSNLAILIYLVRLAKCLIDNNNVCLKPYLQDLLPSIITCVLCRQVCAKPLSDNHWALRDFSAKQLVSICTKYNTAQNLLLSRVSKLIYRVLWLWIEGKQAAEDSTVLSSDYSLKANLGSAIDSLNTAYGVLTCFVEFGEACLEKLVFPHLPVICKRIIGMVASASNTPAANSLAETATTSSLQPLAPSNPELMVVMDQETGLRQTMNTTTAPSSSLPFAELKSFEALKGFMKNKLSVPLASYRLRMGLPVSLDEYKELYGMLAPSLLPPSSVKGAKGGLIVTKPQP